MLFSERRPVLPLLGSALSLAVGLGLVVATPSSSVVAADPERPTTSSTSSQRDFVGAGGYTYPRPTNAAKVYRWGTEEWRAEFEGGGLGAGWKTTGRVDERAGQITLNGGGRSGDVVARATDTRARYGRWESRVRAKQYDGRTPYRFFWELVPVGRFRCGAKSVVLASYRQDQERVQGGVRVKDQTEFAFSKRIDLRIGYFHTFAVEITRKHVSWFVDREVVRTERRPAATTGTIYQPRLRMEAIEGRAMARSRMQADWVRYYDLSRPGAKSIAAPGMDKRPYERTNC